MYLWPQIRPKLRHAAFKNLGKPHLQPLLQTMFDLVLLLLLCTPFIWWYLVLHKFRSLKGIPGPKPLPIIGNALDIGGSPQELLQNAVKFFNRYGDVFKIYIGGDLKVFIANAELFEKIMGSNVHITKSDGYFLLNRFINYGLLTSTGAKWKLRRKMITPTFHFKILVEFLTVFNASGDILIDKLSQQAVDKGAVDLYDYIAPFALDVVCETAMGVQISTQIGKNLEFSHSLRSYFDIFMTRFFSSWKKFETLYKLSPEYSSYERHLKVLHTFTGDVISRRRAERTRLDRPKTSDVGGKQRNALLDLLLESEHNNELTNEDIKEEINTFMFEGYETTTSGISFTLLALADHLDVQERVYEEIAAVVGNETCLTMQHLQETRYLEMVLKEVQRVYSAVPFVERRLETDAEMGGFRFPKDTTLTLFLYQVHRNEKYFSEPEKFDPDRFLPENQSRQHNYAFVPFSAGPRNCIGQKFAMLDMKVTIIKVLQNFKVLPVAGYSPELGMAAILKSYNGIKVQLARRDKDIKDCVI